MGRQFNRWLVSAALTALIAASAASPCQSADAPPASSDVPPPPPAERPEALPAPTTPQQQPPAFVLPAPDYNIEPVPEGSHPLLDRPEAALPGFFINVESSVLWPRFRNELVGGAVTASQLSSQPPGAGVAPNSAVGLPPGAGLPITGDIVKFPGNTLDPTVSPRFELGYRFPEGFGEVRLGYRFLDTRGSDTVLVAPPFALDNFGLASQTGRLDINIVDFDWGTREFSLWPNWEMRTAIGLRYATAFLDSQVVFLNPVTLTATPFGNGPFTRIGQSEALANRYVGVHAVLEVGRKLPLPGLTLFGRVEGAGMYGRVHQTFRESFVEAPGFVELRVANGVGTPWANGQVGFSYEVPRWNHSRFMIGYQFEEWWVLGRGNNDLSFGQLNVQGLFLRAEFNF